MKIVRIMMRNDEKIFYGWIGGENLMSKDILEIFMGINLGHDEKGKKNLKIL